MTTVRRVNFARQVSKTEYSGKTRPGGTSRGMSLGKHILGYVPIESLSKEKVVSEPPVPRPEVGLRWGEKSDFEFEGKPDKQKYTLKVYVFPERTAPYERTEVFSLSPVYRDFSVFRLWDRTHEYYIDVEYTSSVVIPVGTETVEYISGYTFYKDRTEPIMKTRTINAFVQLYIDIPNGITRGDHQYNDSEGEYPKAPYIGWL